jgi:hypothetical protein
MVVLRVGNGNSIEPLDPDLHGSILEVGGERRAARG